MGRWLPRIRVRSWWRLAYSLHSPTATDSGFIEMASSSIAPRKPTDDTDETTNEEARIDTNADVNSSSSLAEEGSEPIDVRVSDIIDANNPLSLFPQKRLEVADELKSEGNDHFREKRWNEALAQYRSALGHLPKRKEKKQLSPQHTEDTESEGGPDADKGKQRETEYTEQADPMLTEYARRRAVLNANIGACYVKLVIYESLK